MTSYVPDPTDVTNPTDAIDAETAAPEFRALKSYIQQLIGGTNAIGGFVNKFRNGTFDIAQRGPVTINSGSSGYTSDGWVVSLVGANAVCDRAASGTNLTGKGLGSVLRITPLGVITDLEVYQRVESLQADDLTSQSMITAQITAFNAGTGALTPVLHVVYPNTPDNYGATTQVLADGVLQVLPPGQWTTLAYSFSSDPGFFNGVEIVFDFGQTSAQLLIGWADLRNTPGTISGVQNAAPAPELRLPAYEAADARRYLNVFSHPRAAIDVLAIGIAASTSAINIIIPLMAAMRNIPANTYLDSAASDFAVVTSTGGLFSCTNLSASAILNESQYAFTLEAGLSGAVLVAGNPYFFGMNGSGAFITISAEL